MRSYWFIGLMALLFLLPADVVAQCAMCRGTVESTVSNGRSVVASDLNFGIAYLLAFPYLMVAAIAYLWYRNSLKERGKRLEIASRVRRAMSRM